MMFSSRALVRTAVLASKARNVVQLTKSVRGNATEVHAENTLERFSHRCRYVFYVVVLSHFILAQAGVIKMSVFDGLDPGNNWRCKLEADVAATGRYRETRDD